MTSWYFQNDLKTNDFFLRFFPLASRKRPNQKNSVTESKQNHPISGIKKVPVFFRSDLFLEARTEILTNISLFFGRFEDIKRTFRNQLTFTPLSSKNLRN